MPANQRACNYIWLKRIYFQDKTHLYPKQNSKMKKILYFLLLL